MQIPYLQPSVTPPPQPPAPITAVPVRAQAVEPARQVTASRAGGENSGKERPRMGAAEPDPGDLPSKRRGELLDLFV